MFYKHTEVIGRGKLFNILSIPRIFFFSWYSGIKSYKLVNCLFCFFLLLSYSITVSFAVEICSSIKSGCLISFSSSKNYKSTRSCALGSFINHYRICFSGTCPQKLARFCRFLIATSSTFEAALSNRWSGACTVRNFMDLKLMH